MDFSVGSTGVGNIHTPTANQPLNASVVIERVGSRNKQISQSERHEVLKERFLLKHSKMPQFSFGQMRHLLHVDDKTILQLERETGQKLRRSKPKRHKKSIR
ncbi:hypothetical protein K9863_03220 [Lactobacillaceae bacterium KNUT 0156]|nr:hypothetical protein [Weissella cibaria]